VRARAAAAAATKQRRDAGLTKAGKRAAIAHERAAAFATLNQGKRRAPIPTKKQACAAHPITPRASGITQPIQSTL
jgi:hypothetical protein